MSRKREAQREKRHELARQLGVGSAEVDHHRHLAENARVTRPVLRVVALEPRGGVLTRRFSRPERLVVALFLVDSKGAHLLHAQVLEEGERQLDKLTYHRPAHFVVVAFTARDPEPCIAALSSGAALTLDEHRIDDGALAASDWERPRPVRLGGLPGAVRGAAVSVRGVARVSEQWVLPLERCAPTVELEV